MLLKVPGPNVTAVPGTYVTALQYLGPIRHVRYLGPVDDMYSGVVLHERLGYQLPVLLVIVHPGDRETVT
jgi:hypothetical protein